MTIKRNIIFCSVLVAGSYTYAMDRRTSNGPQSLREKAWEKHQEERRQFFQKLGEPMPRGQTYEEAITTYHGNQIYNDLAMGKEMAQQMESQKK